MSLAPAIHVMSLAPAIHVMIRITQPKRVLAEQPDRFLTRDRRSIHGKEWTGMSGDEDKSIHFICAMAVAVEKVMRGAREEQEGR
eukprot:765966-Hanusia_phi.AAC.5